MNWKHIFARKDLEVLLAEAAGEHRLHRVLGPWSLTALGVGCIIGAGIFVVTGRAAALDAGPGVILSYAIAGIGCALAALCYAEFAAMAPVAGSAYTYAYTTLGEIFAWIIGWDLILEYAMGCATVASAWTNYFNSLLDALHWPQIPSVLCNPPWTVDSSTAGIINLPAVILVGLITVILVLGIRESARTNATLVSMKLVVVVFVIVLGVAYVKPSNWTSVPVSRRHLPEEKVVAEIVKEYLKSENKLTNERAAALESQVKAKYREPWERQEMDLLVKQGLLTPKARDQRLAELATAMPKSADDTNEVEKLLPEVKEKGKKKAVESWGLLGTLGLNRWLTPIDDATRSPFMPYGFSGIMLGAAIVFFAFIGFDSISTHAEEARNPQRDVPFGILTSLFVCTLLYIIVAAVITGMVPYPDIDVKAPISTAFAQQPGADKSLLLRGATALISAGGLAGMTSVLLVLFLSQARVFMAMSRDGLLPEIFGTVHPKFQTPHIATMVTGAFIAVTAGLTPIKTLHEMVNIGTLLAFVMVCAAVFILRFQRPNSIRPFRCPIIYVVAPLGIFVNVLMMLFLPVDSWLRLVGWLSVGMVIYFAYSLRHSHLAKHLMQEIGMPRKEVTGTKFDPEVLE
ncbi:MAG: amino acid permease [Planctomycetota bacterium]